MNGRPSIEPTGMTAALAFIFLTAAAPAARAASQPDAWITTKAKLALITASHVGDNSVHVDTNEGRVTLYGKATTQVEKDHAGEIARGIIGVKHVRNLLQVVPAAAQKGVNESDDHIKTEVQQAIKDDGLEGNEISVKSVDKGMVLLMGKAPNLSGLLYAVEAASMVPGVRRVASEVKAPNEIASLDTGSIPAEAKRRARDAWITTATKMRLMADLNVPALDISVDTYNGVVTLFGSVPSKDARVAAVADAQKVDATVKVHDELQIIARADKAGATADDGAVKKQVTKGFTTNPAFRHVDVAVHNGVVHLTGSVPSGWMRLRAAIIARAATGARAVEDDLRVEAQG